MENLKELVAKVNTENPTENDLRVLSIKKYYLNLKRDRKYKEWRILKLLVCLYPNFIKKNNFRVIEDTINNPRGKTVVIRDRHEFTRFEEYALKKKYGDSIPTRYSVSFSLSDLLDYFEIKY
jgi:hypothetical protein